MYCSKELLLSAVSTSQMYFYSLDVEGAFDAILIFSGTILFANQLDLIYISDMCLIYVVLYY